MPNQIAIDATFRALADPVRRAMIAALAAGPQPVKTLAEPHNLRLPTVLQHLSVLEAGGIVTTKKTGRVRMVRLEGDGLRAAEDWLSGRRALWERRLDALEQHLNDTKESDT